MNIGGANVVITGAAAGIGAALATALADSGAAAILIADRDLGAAEVAAQHIGGRCRVLAERCDSANGADLEALVQRAERALGRVHLFCSNAGLMADGGLELADDTWQQSWAVNVMSHVHAARAAIPGMLRHGGGHLLNVCSAAGMLTAPGAAAYTASKHAALGFAEWLAIVYGPQGIGVSALCPEAVRTDMLNASLAGNEGVRRIVESGVVLDPAAVAETAVAGLKEGRFLLLSHPRTLANTQRKWADPGRWIKGMQEFLHKAA